jgi:hypothetical protein
LDVERNGHVNVAEGRKREVPPPKLDNLIRVGVESSQRTVKRRQARYKMGAGDQAGAGTLI